MAFVNNAVSVPAGPEEPRARGSGASTVLLAGGPPFVN